MEKITDRDRVGVGSGKAPVQPALYKTLNTIFSDTNANIEVASKASDIYIDSASESDDSFFKTVKVLSFVESNT